MASKVSKLKNCCFLTYIGDKKLELKQHSRQISQLNTVQVKKKKNNRDFKTEFECHVHERNAWICGCEVTNRLYRFPCLLFEKEGGKPNWVSLVSVIWRT